MVTRTAEVFRETRLMLGLWAAPTMSSAPCTLPAGFRPIRLLWHEGDPYHTDGEIDVASLVIDGAKRTEAPMTLPPPPLIALKDQIWHTVNNAVSQ
jgi:hypothetical protein